MAYNFPDSPTVGQVFQAWTWNGEAWVLTLPLNVEYVLKSGDVMGGHLGLPTGPSASQAVRKDYVDAGLASVDLSSKVSKVGDTMSGALTIAYASAPTTGYLVFGNSGQRYIGYDGANYVMPGAHLYTADGKLWGDADFSKPLPLVGGTMTGKITSAGGGEMNAAGPASSMEIISYNGSGWAPMAFHVQGAFGTNFGLNSNGNFYMGGWSHGGAIYQFWTSRDFSPGSYQPALGFTPVRQSGGAYQLTNTVYLGWDGGGLRAQVDATDLGKIRTEGNTITGGRLVHAGDPSDLTGAMYEPYAGAVITGLACGRFPDARVAFVNGRYRYMQLCTTSWFTISYA